MKRYIYKGLFISVLYIASFNSIIYAQNFPDYLDIIIIVDVSGSMEFSLDGCNLSPGTPSSIGVPPNPNNTGCTGCASCSEGVHPDPSWQRMHYTKPGLIALSTVFEKLLTPANVGGPGVDQVRFAIGRFPGEIPGGSSIPDDFSWLEENGNSDLRDYNSTITATSNELHDIVNNDVNITWKGTPLGTAVIEAINMHNNPLLNPPASVTSGEFILLFTDGKKRGGENVYNTDSYGDELHSGSGANNVRSTEIRNHIDHYSVTSDDDEIKIISLGFADFSTTSSEVDLPLLLDISASSPAIYDPNETGANFTKDAVYSAFSSVGYSLTVLTDPSFLIDPSDIKEHLYQVTKYDNRLIFMVSWNDPKYDSVIKFTLQTPSAKIIDLEATQQDQHLEYDEGETFQMYTIHNSFLQNNTGEWKMIINGDEIKSPEWYAYTVIGISDLQLKDVTPYSQQPKFTGDHLQLEISLTADGTSIEDAEVIAKITGPKTSAGNWYANYPLTPAQLDSVKNIPFQGMVEDFYKKFYFMHHLMGIALPENNTYEIHLKYNPKNGFYQGNSPEFFLPGIYKVEISASQNPDNKQLIFNRDLIKHYYIKDKPDTKWKYSLLEIEDISTKKDKDYDIYLIKFTPKDQYHNYVKPGNGDKIKFNVRNAFLSEESIIDDLQGSYYKKVKVRRNALRPKIEVKYGSFVFKERFISDNLRKDNWRINPNAISLHFGMVLPTGNTATNFNGGFHASIDYYRQISRKWALNGIVGYSQFEDLATNSLLEYWNISLNVRWFPIVSSIFRLYINGGGGLYLNNQNSSNNAGYNIGLGFNLPVTPHIDIEAGSDFNTILITPNNFTFIRPYAGILIRI